MYNAWDSWGLIKGLLPSMLPAVLTDPIAILRLFGHLADKVITLLKLWYGNKLGNELKA